MTKVGVGKSKKYKAFEAGVEAAQQALNQAGARECNLAIVFASPGYQQQELLDGVSSITKESALVGCSVEGVISQEGRDEEQKRVGLMAVSSETMKFTPVMGRSLRGNSEGVGQDLAERLNQTSLEQAKVLVLLPDGLTVNPEALFRGLEGTLERRIPIVGGTSGGSLDLKNTYQYFNGQVLEDAVVGVLMANDFQFEIGVSHGAEATGIEKTITKAEANHIYEIDHKPAFEVFREFLGEDIEELDALVVNGVCLGVRTPQQLKEKYEEVVLRIPLRLDKKDDSLYMAAEWPEGTKVLICQRNPEQIIAKTKETAQRITNKMADKEPLFVLNFNCAGRSGKLMGEKVADQEVEANQQILGKEVPWLGGYTFGEIAPVGENNYFHNWTDVVFVVYS